MWTYHSRYKIQHQHRKQYRPVMVDEARRLRFARKIHKTAEACINWGRRLATRHAGFCRTASAKETQDATNAAG